MHAFSIAAAAAVAPAAAASGGLNGSGATSTTPSQQPQQSPATNSSSEKSSAGADSQEGLVTAADFLAAMHHVGPSIVRSQQAELPPVDWSDIGGYPALKRRLQQAVEWPLRHAGAFERLGLSAPRGVLLHGPPGCSKTMLARAAASGSGATFLPLSCAQVRRRSRGWGGVLAFGSSRFVRLGHLWVVRELGVVSRRHANHTRKPHPPITHQSPIQTHPSTSTPQLYSMYVGEGEATLRDVFARARMAAPSIIFLDEADAIAPGRGGGGGGAPDVAMRLLSTLLTELDGLESSKGGEP